MKFTTIAKGDLERKTLIYQSYCSSFPADERRDSQQFEELFNHPKTKVLIVEENRLNIGYLILWKLSDCWYLEHFEVFERFRNEGWGSKVLALLKGYFPKIILESEPDFQNKIAARRIKFYQRNGFEIIDRKYLQPPYGKGKDSISLFLLSNFPTPDLAQTISEIYRTVYQC